MGIFNSHFQKVQKEFYTEKKRQRSLQARREVIKEASDRPWIAGEKEIGYNQPKVTSIIHPKVNSGRITKQYLAPTTASKRTFVNSDEFEMLKRQVNLLQEANETLKSELKQVTSIVEENSPSPRQENTKSEIEVIMESPNLKRTQVEITPDDEDGFKNMKNNIFEVAIPSSNIGGCLSKMMEKHDQVEASINGQEEEFHISDNLLSDDLHHMTGEVLGEPKTEATVELDQEMQTTILENFITHEELCIDNAQNDLKNDIIE